MAVDLSTLHLTDFGSSRALRTGDVPVTSTTINFSAPEVLAGEIPSEKHDVWGAGLCLYFMLVGLSVTRGPLVRVAGTPLVHV